MIGPDKTLAVSEVARSLNASPDSEVLAFDNVKFKRFEESVPIRIDGLAIILCYSGRAVITIDITKYELTPNSLLIIQPNNFVRSLDPSPDFQTYAVLCSVNVVQTILPKLTDLLPVLMQHRLMPVTRLTETEADGIKAFYKFIKLKIEEPATPFRRQKVMSMLQAALFEMMDIRLAREDAEGVTHSRKEEIAARFILSVTENFRRERQVAFYAKQLCITPKHLSTVVRETTGRTAGEWIDSYVMMEAKMLLHTTNLTIQEITTRLNFTNQSFFGKYFKHHSGQSPTAFRNSDV